MPHIQNPDSKWVDRLSPLIFGLVIFSLALFGIITRAPGLLAALWPANAVMLGLLVRFPWLNRLSSWVMATAGYLLADLLTHGALPKTFMLTLANLAGVATGNYLFRKQSAAVRNLTAPMSIMRCIVIAIFASFAAGIVGAVANPLVFHHPALDGFLFWFATELVHYLAILPVILALPSWDIAKNTLRTLKINRIKPAHFIPTLALIACLALSAVEDGPGALSFSVPALLWCATTYTLFTSTLITLIFSLWMLYAISVGFIDLGVGPVTQHWELSIRLGVIFIALSPLETASALAARGYALRLMEHNASHDYLTKALNRAGFFERARPMLRATQRNNQPVTLFMLDLDHFKKINDTYGHAGGDLVLARTADLISRQLRSRDIFARFGGEEFVILIGNEDHNAALAIANRICELIAAEKLSINSSPEFSFTLSIGAAHDPSGQTTLDEMLKRADSALYLAKGVGRNQVVCQVVNSK